MSPFGKTLPAAPVGDATLHPLPGWGGELWSPHQDSLSTALSITLQTRSGAQNLTP